MWRPNVFSKPASSNELCTASLAMVPPIGAAASWAPRLALATCVWPGCGQGGDCSLTGVATTLSVMSRSWRKTPPNREERR